MPIQLSRRRFTQAAGAALTVAIGWPSQPSAQSPAAAPRGTFPRLPHAARPEPASFIRITPDGTVTFVLPTCEMGQGAHTGQAMVLAEELGADWQRVRTAMPPQTTPDYRLPMGQQRSVGSFGLRHWHDPLRRAAAQVREMLTTVAAHRLGVDAGALWAENGFIVHAASGRRIAFGELAAAAAVLPVPAEPVLRPADQRTLTGKTMRRLDTPAKVAGTAVFGIDAKVPGLLHGAVRLSPVFRAEVADLDPAGALAMPGVRAVVRVPHGAVVVADGWWQARQAAERLDMRYHPTPHDGLDSAEIDRRLSEALGVPVAQPALNRGDVAAAFQGAARIVQADYAVPLLAHACMEPINCTAQAGPQRLDLWTGTQGHDVLTADCAAAGGYRPDQVFFHNAYLGGGFGRKSHSEAAVQATLASRAVGGRPVKVIWSRADDLQQGQYRQTMMARMSAALDAQGRIQGWRVRIAGPQMGREYGGPPNLLVDPASLGGIVDLPYQVPNLLVEHAVVPVPMALCPWRSIANSFTCFFVESFIDECAAAAGQDPLDYRRAHLQGRTRLLAVLDRVALNANWSSPPPAGVARGIAVVECYGSPVAEVVEARLRDGRVQVEKVHVAIDCGRAINPGQVHAQLRGSVVDALGPTLRTRITIRDGRTEQASFGDYRVLRMGEEPLVASDIVEIGSPLGGAGEPAVPPVAPAVASAVRQLTGRPARQLPLSTLGLA